MIQFGVKSNLKTAPFLMNTVEGADNSVRFLISPGTKGEAANNFLSAQHPQLHGLLSQCIPIQPAVNLSYEILFEDYVLYMVRNESFSSGDQQEISHGDYFVLFEASFLLDHASYFCASELVEAIRGKKCHHYEIICQNHVVDILTTNSPMVRECPAL